MAKIKFNRGTKTKINSSAISDGSLNLATDDGTLYADVSSTKRIELNPQSDWNVTDTSSKGYIKNKPNLSSYATKTEVNSKLSLSGGTLTGSLVGTSFQTGEGEANYFQCRKFRGEGNADTYYHAIDFGYAGHDQVDFYEYGGVWNFWKNTSSDVGGTLVGSIRSTGWNGNVVGNVTGNASTATKATQDASGNVITTTYAKKSEIPSVPVKGVKISGSTSNLTPDTSGIVTIPAIPTKVSTFTNDSGYLTTHQDLSGYQTKLSFDNTPTYGSSNPVTSAGIRVYVDEKIPTKMSQLTNDSGYGKYIKYAVTITASSVVSSTTHSSDGFGYSFSLGYGGCTSDWYADIVFPSTFKDPYWLETGTNIINVYFISKPSSTLNCTLILIHG